MTQPQRRPASSSPDPVLITDAARSYEEELRVRKRRYALMMGMRVPCMVLAAVFYETPWLAVTLLIISIPLPWMAVLIANDRLPRKSEKVNRYQADRPALEARPRPVIDSGHRTGFDGPVDRRGRPRRPRRHTGRPGRPPRRLTASAPAAQPARSAASGPAPASHAASSPASNASPAPVASTTSTARSAAPCQHTVPVHPARARPPRRDDHGARDVQQRRGRARLG